MNDDIAKDIILVMREFKDVVKEHQQSLQSQRLLLMALSGSVADVPLLIARYQELLRENEHTTGVSLPEIQISSQVNP